MPAPTGNTNAEIWTLERTLSMLTLIQKYAKDDQIFTLSEALLASRCYKQLWSYWKKKWELNGEVMDAIYYIEQIFIVKTEKAALFKVMNPSACFFILKYNYGFGTKKADELPAHLAAEFEQAVPEVPEVPVKEAVAETTNEFSPRPTDSEEAARMRAEARRNPHLFRSRPPVIGNM